jgi:hypothetical protein
MEKQKWFDNALAKWMAPAFVGKSPQDDMSAFAVEQNKRLKWTGAPVEVQNAFISEGRTKMEIPVRNQLTGFPALGDSPLEGNEESQIFTMRSVEINRTRKAVAPPTGMSLQSVKQWKRWLAEDCTPQLMQWWHQWFPGCIYAACYTGYSLDLTQGAIAGGLAQAYVSHPNMWVAGSGLVSSRNYSANTWSNGTPGTTAYENAVASAFDAMTNATNYQMSWNTLRSAIYQAARQKVQPVIGEDGIALYAVWMNDAAFLQLQSDPNFQAVAKTLLPKDYLAHPLASGASAFVPGAAIFTDYKLWYAYTHTADSNVTSGLVEYGPRPSAAQRGQGWKIGNFMTTLDSGVGPTAASNIAISLIIGRSMLSVGQGEKMKIEENVKDYGNNKGYALDVIQSVVRNETYDETNQLGAGANAFYENTSSMAIATYSPSGLPTA